MLRRWDGPEPPWLVWGIAGSIVAGLVIGAILAAAGMLFLSQQWGDLSCAVKLGDPGPGLVWVQTDRVCQRA